MDKKQLTEELVELRHTLHQIPELRADLPETTKIVKQELDKLGIPYEVVEGGGIFATLGQGEKTIMLRADMDALPIEEQSCEDFASSNGNMHACGHDLHTSMLIGAGKILKEREQELKNKVVLFFEYDEEKGSGMDVVMESKILDSLDIDAVMGLHCLPGEDMKPGTYVCHPGPANSAYEGFNVKVIGKTAHGANPSQGKNPINACVQIYNALSGLVPFEIDARRSAVMSICYFNAGNPMAHNIIPETAEMGGTIRAHRTEDAKYLVKRLTEISNGIAESLNMECEINLPLSHPAAVNHKDIVNLINGCAEELGMVNLDIPAQMVSDTFGYLTEHYPGAYVWIGVSGEEDKYKGGILHSPNTCFSDDTLIYGAELLAKVALEFGK